jgi:hypothetical protein
MSNSQAHKQKKHKETTLNSSKKHYSPPNHFHHHSADTQSYRSVSRTLLTGIGEWTVTYNY